MRDRTWALTIGALVYTMFASVILSPPAAAQTTSPAPSHEQVQGGIFDASDPPGLLRLITDGGYQASLGREADGDPVIRGRISRTDYRIQFYECESGTFCNSVQFVAEGRPAQHVDLGRLNAFNLRWRYVRATLADNLVRLQKDVNLDGGVTAANLEDTLDIWRQLVETFEREFLEPDPGGRAPL